MHERLNPEGLSEHCTLAFARLGHQGSRLVFRVDPEVMQREEHQETGLRYFPINEVFHNRHSILIDCGSPNMTVALCDDDKAKEPKWYQLAAFMFWRKKAFLANTKGRIQSGITFELLGLPDEARKAIRHHMEQAVGKRGVSCAHQVGKVFHNAGFTFGNGRSLVSAVRPTKFVSLGWQHGLAYKGQPVDIRIIVTGDKTVAAHMKDVWLRETSSLGRTVKKKYAEHKEHIPAPIFEAKQFAPIDSKRWESRETTICTNRPGWLGVKLAFLWGQQPVYSVKLDDMRTIDTLNKPLTAYPGKLNLVTKIKKRILFSKFVTWVINHLRIKTTDCFEGIPARAALEMLLRSPGADIETATLYNCIVTLDEDGQGEARITGLRNQDLRAQNSRWVRFVSWILAKHVLLSGHHPRTIYASELWTYKNGDGEMVLCLNENSGTYQPTTERRIAIASYLQELFGIPVQSFSTVKMSA